MSEIRTGKKFCTNILHRNCKNTYSMNIPIPKTQVTSPTHGKSLLDLFYTNMAGYYSIPQHYPGIGLSVHQVIVLTPSIPAKLRPKTVKISRRRQGRKERLALIRAIDKINWSPLYTTLGCEEQLSMFNAVMQQLIDTFLPYHTVKRNTNDQPWVTDEFIELIKLRQQHFRQGTENEYKYYRNKVNRTRKVLKKKYYEKKLKNLKAEKPRHWWKDINDITGRKKSTNSHFTNLANAVCQGDITKLVQQINQSFLDVTVDFIALTPSDIRQQQYTIPECYTITVEQVMTCLLKINTSKAQGPDDIPNWILKACAISLASPLCSIFNGSIREGNMPVAWKCGDICPIPKTQTPTDISKHLRPILLTSQLSKCLERFPRDWLMDNIKDILDPHQYGSLPNSSTILALAEMLHNWYVALETPKQAVRILFIDFAKAFDRIDHRILLSKLESMNEYP